MSIMFSHFLHGIKIILRDFRINNGHAVLGAEGVAVRVQTSDDKKKKKKKKA